MINFDLIIDNYLVIAQYFSIFYMCPKRYGIITSFLNRRYSYFFILFLFPFSCYVALKYLKYFLYKNHLMYSTMIFWSSTSKLDRYSLKYRSPDITYASFSKFFILSTPSWPLPWQTLSIITVIWLAYFELYLNANLQMYRNAFFKF